MHADIMLVSSCAEHSQMLCRTCHQQLVGQAPATHCAIWSCIDEKTRRLTWFCDCRLPFAYVYLSCLWIMWLLKKYYSAFVILRQRFLTSGELSTNEWHEQYMQTAVDDKSKADLGKGKMLAALRQLQQLFDPNEVSCDSKHNKLSA